MMQQLFPLEAVLHPALPWQNKLNLKQPYPKRAYLIEIPNFQRKSLKNLINWCNFITKFLKIKKKINIW